MSENTTTNPFSVADLLPVLKRFADGYAPAKHEKRVEKLSGQARDVLKMKRQLAETSLRHKQYLVAKTAEPEANAVDCTFRREREVASAAMSGDPWEAALVYKNPDLWRFLKAIKSKLQAIETVVRSPEPASCFEPYVELYERRLVTLGVQFVTLLQATYSGSCWGVFNNVRKRANEVYREITTIVETEGVEVPDEAVRFARAKVAQPEVAEKAA